MVKVQRHMWLTPSEMVARDRAVYFNELVSAEDLMGNHWILGKANLISGRSRLCNIILRCDEVRRNSNQGECA